MTELTTRERFIRTLTGQDTDRVPFIKLFGGDNHVLPAWEKEYPGLHGTIDELLGFEGGYRGWRITPVNFWLCGEISTKVLFEDADSITVEYDYGRIEKVHKRGDYHAHVLQYPVKGRDDWDRIKVKYLNPADPNRIPMDWENHVESYRNREFPLQLTCGGVYGFARTMMGDEALCYAFYDDPGLVHEIMDGYVSFCLTLWERLCAKVQFDLIESWEDMASKTGSIVSPAIFSEFLAPNFHRIRDFADAFHIPLVMVDCDGNINALVKQMNDCGVNALYPFEVGAGCDPDRALRELPSMSALGCLEKNACALGEEAIEAQMVRAKELIRNGRCIPGPDHFVLENVSFSGYQRFMDRLRQVVLSTRPGSDR
jgi:uroporphyrinogen-III decarboxylase